MVSFVSVTVRASAARVLVCLFGRTDMLEGECLVRLLQSTRLNLQIIGAL